MPQGTGAVVTIVTIVTIVAVASALTVGVLAATWLILRIIGRLSDLAAWRAWEPDVADGAARELAADRRAATIEGE